MVIECYFWTLVIFHNITFNSITFLQWTKGNGTDCMGTMGFWLTAFLRPHLTKVCHHGSLHRPKTHPAFVTIERNRSLCQGRREVAHLLSIPELCFVVLICGWVHLVTLWKSASVREQISMTELMLVRPVIVFAWFLDDIKIFQIQGSSELTTKQCSIRVIILVSWYIK